MTEPVICSPRRFHPSFPLIHFGASVRVFRLALCRVAKKNTSGLSTNALAGLRYSQAFLLAAATHNSHVPNLFGKTFRFTLSVVNNDTLWSRVQVPCSRKPIEYSAEQSLEIG